MRGSDQIKEFSRMLIEPYQPPNVKAHVNPQVLEPLQEIAFRPPLNGGCI